MGSELASGAGTRRGSDSALVPIPRGAGKLMDEKEIQNAAAGRESCLGTLEGAETGREGREGETTAASEEKGALKFGEHRNKEMCRTGGSSQDLLWHR